MEELLRYALLNMAWKVLKIEFAIIAGCLVAVVLIKAYSGLKESWNNFVKGRLSERISEAISKNQTHLAIPWHLRGYRNLLVTIEGFNQKIDSPHWDELKTSVIKRHLLKKARHFQKSRRWAKRHLGARCYQLVPACATEKELAALLNDKQFLIRVIAAEAIIQTSHKDLFRDVIEKMSQETPLSRFSYRDAIISAEKEKFDWLEELIEQEPDPAFCAICLDLLSTRTTNNLFPKLLPFIYGQDRQCRLLAIKILKNIPGRETAEVLEHCLNDIDWKIRLEAIKSLDALHNSKAMRSIEDLLNDSIWFVRLHAALALKSYGTEGIQILSSRNPDKEPQAYEIARYALALPTTS